MSRAARAEQLFRAAVSAFCALTRPPRSEIDRLDDLTLSLLAHVPPAAKRFAAAAFSETPHAPAGLVRRLSEETIDIAAPLLARSPILSDTDLVGIIGRRGLAHARVISRRDSLNPAIAGLTGVLLRHSEAGQSGHAESPKKMAETTVASADQAREELRVIMADGGGPRKLFARDPYRRLRDTALDGHLPLFHTALADLTGLSFAAARRLAEDGSSALPAALHALGLKPEEAFLIVAAIHPRTVTGPATIRMFLERFSAPPNHPDLKPSESAAARFSRA